MKEITITERDMEELETARAAKEKQAAYRRAYRQRPHVKEKQALARAARAAEARRNKRLVEELNRMGVLAQFIGSNNKLDVTA